MVKRGSLLLVFVAMCSCATVSDQPRLTVVEVIRLADAEARRHGYNLRDYERPVPRYNYATRNDTWWVNYDPIKGSDLAKTLGADFSVTIEDKTKKLWLLPGR
jgi:hypothetical protein